MLPYAIGALILFIVIVALINQLVTHHKPKLPKKDEFPFEEEDCYNGRFDRERNRFRKKDT